MIVPDTTWSPDLSTAGRSKYKALAEAIREGIVSGQLTAGTKLPPVRELAYQIGVTPGTVARAYSMMTDEGRLIAEIGRGTFVAGRTKAEPVADVPLINTVDETIADFRSSRVPDVGQGLLIDAALMKIAQSHRRRHINYPTQETDLEAREAVVGWLSSVDMGSVDADHIVLANGAQNACIMALLSELSGATPVILTEDLAYPGVRHAARLLRAKVVGVAMDEHGIIPEALAAAYREHGGQVLVTAPEVHSPTTIKTPLERKQQIAEVARALNIVIIDDDCHSTVKSDVPSYRAILPEQTYYVSSLTKSVTGALRFGFAVAPTGRGALLRQVAQSAHYGVSQPVVDLCCALIKSGDAAKIRADVAEAIAQRVRYAVNMLGRWDIKWREDAPFIYLQLPTGWRASSFMAACEVRGILVKPADEFALPNDRAPNAVRLAIGTCVSEKRFMTAMAEIDAMLGNPESRIDN
ncbi:PLP-dependent aminotransferase family protein [Octadecabacter sp. 1_MG-2023]|uniref:aminotransferase-like domain-containing protein n=1 Tax=unclassified Octadecabacter TaxID=196158 RepID=UPI001C09F254|nr:MULTISPECIES: PLP-dependent aminotransferase family protein [unclassified Octadecabacter]MBU2993341.1 PLP-dependent aminotransferase family protein [Octadecabacter sp. B2R22]MDO6733203.1 PLP-dependent aminotransferase family protein [Octadecabacter sp. 1_MG-2023]